MLLKRASPELNKCGKVDRFWMELNSPQLPQIRACRWLLYMQ